MTSRLPIKSF